ncbi:MAG: SDR family oxidoreductase [Candidatus Hydrogenedentota bacterium]
MPTRNEASSEQSHPGAVVVTGASTGIGAACVAELHQRGYLVFAGVRKSEDGERLQREIAGAIEPVRIDVQDGESIREAAELVGDRAGEAGLRGLVNNAGIVISLPMEFFPLDEFRRQMEVNLTGQIAVAQACLPLLRRTQGRIVNISSLTARVSAPFSGAYSASKCALESVSAAMRMELKPWGIDVICIEPGSVATPLWTKSTDTAKQLVETLPEEAESLYGERHQIFGHRALETGARGIPPGHVAQAVVRALEVRKPRARYVVGWDARFVLLLAKLLPARWMEALTLKAMGL